MGHSSDTAFVLKDVNLFFGSVPILTDVNFAIRSTGITSIIGPSGSGKSTLLRTLNRLNDHHPTFRCTGSVRYRGTDIYANGNGSVDVARLRQDIGMLFQKPCLFPTSIYENVLFGLKRLKLRPRSEFPGIVETTLRAVFLWDEVKDRMKHPANELSQGQQQRLSLARALACEPEVLLLDEPTASLDPKSTQAIESLIRELGNRLTVILVTHRLEQAKRLSETVIFLSDGCVCEWGGVDDIFTCPSKEITQQYLAGHTP
ncbi:MAG TPA: phosphate ABC transporter ATP-binding protein [Nitrospirales bacterium]|nr:phosphate ABC transporter ATP-binding protein [Nitrospirales bacterium]